MEPIKAIEFERLYDASQETVWEAWTNPEMVKQWWGPDNVVIPECEIDLRVGGKIYIVMEAGEAMGPYKGTQWPMLGQFTAVEPYSKLAYAVQAWTEGHKEETTIDQTTELTLTEEQGKTKLTIKAVIYKVGPQAGMAVQGMQAGFTQQLEKLNVFLSAKK
ncbi:MAG TPA: SRPBCC domain-containing protein [Nitrososphaera sp.]|nr:SRPBCC domain-containing protein [Nitrososphaera sp.]